MLKNNMYRKGKDQSHELLVKAPDQKNLWYKPIDFIHRLKNRGDVHFHSDHLIRLYGGRYKKQIINPLVDMGLIEVNDSYKVGKYSKRYTLLDTDFHTWIDTPIRYSALDGAHVFSKYVKHRLQLPNNIRGLIELHVSSTINTNTITVSNVSDFDGNVYENGSFVPIRGTSLFDFSDAKVYTYGSYSIVSEEGLKSAVESLKNIKRDVFTRCVDFINLDDYYVQRGKKSRRIYHPISILPKALRSGLTIDDERLVQIDMKNAQFALWVYGIDKPIKWELHDRISGDAKKYLPFLDYEANLVAEKAFTSAAKQGSLYEYMSAVFNQHDRALTKKKVFESLFGTLHHTHEEYKALTRHIPNVVKKIKAHRRESDINLAVALQNLEAAIFIDYFLPNLVYRGIPCCSIHDCLLVKESDIEAAIHIIRMLSKNIELQATFEIDGKDKFNTMATTCSLVSAETRKAVSFQDMALPTLYDQFLATL